MIEAQTGAELIHHLRVSHDNLLSLYTSSS